MPAPSLKLSGPHSGGNMVALRVAARPLSEALTVRLVAHRALLHRTRSAPCDGSAARSSSGRAACHVLPAACRSARPCSGIEDRRRAPSSPSRRPAARGRSCSAPCTLRCGLRSSALRSRGNVHRKQGVDANERHPVPLRARLEVTALAREVVAGIAHGLVAHLRSQEPGRLREQRPAAEDRVLPDAGGQCVRIGCGPGRGRRLRARRGQRTRQHQQREQQQESVPAPDEHVPRGRQPT